MEVVVDDGRNYLASPAGRLRRDRRRPARARGGPPRRRSTPGSTSSRCARALAADGVFCQWLPALPALARPARDHRPHVRRRVPGDHAVAGQLRPDRGHAGPRRPPWARALWTWTRSTRRARRLAASGERNAVPAGPRRDVALPRRPLAARDCPGSRGAPRTATASPGSSCGARLAHAARDQARAGRRPGDGLLEQVAREPPDGTPLRGLDDRHRAWTATGAALLPGLPRPRRGGPAAGRGVSCGRCPRAAAVARS